MFASWSGDGPNLAIKGRETSVQICVCIDFNDGGQYVGADNYDLRFKPDGGLRTGSLTLFEPHSLFEICDELISCLPSRRFSCYYLNRAKSGQEETRDDESLADNTCLFRIELPSRPAI
jgi:hypothetical protein